jgi:hypothetical protein
MSDAELLSLVLSGNTARFEALVDRYLPRVRALCASHVYTEAAHDDLVQETFVERRLKLNTLHPFDRRRSHTGNSITGSPIPESPRILEAAVSSRISRDSFGAVPVFPN